MTREDKIFAYFSHMDDLPLSEAELATALSVPPSDRGELRAMLDALVREGRLVKNKKGRYRCTVKLTLINGEFRAKKKGGGFVIPSDGSADVYIAPENMLDAIHHDIVLVRVIRRASADKKKKREGEILRVVKRANAEIIGSLHRQDGHCSLIPDDHRLGFRVLLSKKQCTDYKEGDKLAVTLTRYPKEGLPARAEVTDYIGAGSDAATDTKSIIRRFQIPEEFGEKALIQAAATQEEVTEAECAGRTDFRDDMVITIDGEDARDLDDAVSVVRRPDGSYTLCVHIADVTHYVRESTAIDLEAFERATSVYFPDRVVPMLPRELSNGICSLNPDCDRLTLSVVMQLSAAGEVTDYRIVKGVIRSRYRMTYTMVTALLDGSAAPDERAHYRNLLPMLSDMEELSERLQAYRRRRGSIDFDFPEPKISMDEAGNVTDVCAYPIGVANRMIEQFMLTANETVARHALEHELPFVYRVHEAPDAEKLGALRLFLYQFGLLLPEEAVSSRQIADVLRQAEGEPYALAVQTVTLRSMMKARYEAANLGHFGLAAPYYCHFTSPIRRYPDLVVHRILKEEIDHTLTQKRKSWLKDFCVRAARQSSDREVRAVDAEREADRQKICMYMSSFVGETFDAVISSVTEFGLFVSLPNTVEGFISMRDLDDDYYVYEPEFYRLRGERTKHCYAIGDAIRVILVRVDVHSREIDFLPEQLAHKRTELPAHLRYRRGRGAKRPDSHSTKPGSAKAGHKGKHTKKSTESRHGRNDFSRKKERKKKK